MTTTPPCMDGFDHHCWQATGLDIDDKDRMVHTRRCPSCGLEQVATYGTKSKSWRPAPTKETTP